MRIVLDTNVLVSALLKGSGNEAIALSAALAGQVDLVISADVLAEYELVLRRPRFGFSSAEVRSVLVALRRVGRLDQPTKTIAAATDESDNRFLECAEAANADYVVTGNLKHFPAAFSRTRIINARRLVELLAPQPRGKSRSARE